MAPVQHVWMTDMPLLCDRCNGSGWRAHDSTRVQVCDACCPHDRGWWHLLAAGDLPALWACLAGCGTTLDHNPEDSHAQHAGPTH